MPGGAAIDGMLKAIDAGRIMAITRAMREDPAIDAPVDYDMAQRAFPGRSRWDAQVRLWEMCDVLAHGHSRLTGGM